MENLPHPVTGHLFPSPVPPGTGWPDDSATPETAVATSAADVRRLAAAAADAGADAGAGVDVRVEELSAQVSVCRACPRLVAWREEVAAVKRASFAGQPYWGRPVPGWGSSSPRVLVVGLAPAANGGNRTGRIFTGDRSGDWLFAALHRAGLAASPTSVHAGDGQRLIDTRMVAAVRCAPPANKPTPTERDTCAPWLDAELSMCLPSVRVVVCLGLFGWESALRALARLGCAVPRPRPRFGHGARVAVEVGASRGGSEDGAAGGAAGVSEIAVLGCFHPSQQNTFTGKLTEAMIDSVLAVAAGLAWEATG